MLKECAFALYEYLSKRNDEESSLFLGRAGRRLESGGIYNVINKLGKMSGLTNA